MLSIIAQIKVNCSKELDFVVLPGDNADNGLLEQYQLVATALKMLNVPVQVVSGQVEIRAVVFGSGTVQTVKCRLENNGSDADAIGAWLENGIFGT